MEKKQIQFSLKSQRGFTLSGAMMALGVVSVLGLIIANLSTTASQMFADIEKNNAVTDTFNELRMNLSNKKVCTENFKNTPLAISNNGNNSNTNGSAVTKISTYRIQGSNLLDAGRIIEKDQILSGLRVKDLRLIPGPKLSDALSIVELEATFERNTTDPNAKGIPLVRTLPLLMRIQNDQIQECWVKKPYAEMAYNTICSSSTGGALNTVETSATAQEKDRGYCTLANGKWIEGSMLSATCPAGSTLPKDADSDFNCRPRMPAGFQDPFPQQ